MQFTATARSLLKRIYSQPIPVRIPLEDSPPWFHISDAKFLCRLGYIQYAKETTGDKEQLVIWRSQSPRIETEVCLIQETPATDEQSVEIAFNDDHYQILRYLDLKLARTAQRLEHSYLMVDAVITNKQLGLDRNRISHCLKDLEKPGYVKNNGKRMGWTITDLGQTELARYLAMTPNTGSA